MITPDSCVYSILYIIHDVAQIFRKLEKNTEVNKNIFSKHQGH